MFLPGNGPDISCYSMVVSKMAQEHKYLMLKEKVDTIKDNNKKTTLFKMQQPSLMLVKHK